MKTFPMFLKVEDRKIVIIGGGEQAAQKARLALKTVAKLVFVAPSLDPELADLVAHGHARHILNYEHGLFEQTALTFIATGCKGADAAWHAIAKREGALVNVVDYPGLCDALTPSIVDRDPVVVAIGTEGTAPVLGRRIKTRIEEILHPRLGAYSALAGRLRTEVAQRIPTRDRRAFWRWVFGDAPWTTFSNGNEREAAEIVKSAIQTCSFGEKTGHFCIVSGATDPDLIPMGVVARLQEADTIYVDADVPEAVLEFARRDAIRIPTKAPHQIALSEMLPTAAKPERIVFLCARHPAIDLHEALDVQIERIHCATAASYHGSRSSLTTELRLVTKSQGLFHSESRTDGFDHSQQVKIVK